MSSATIWSRTKNSVTTDVVESRLEQFLPGLCMTRDAVKFPKWTVGTVEKAFKWADYLHEVSQFADAVQKEAILRNKKLFMRTEIPQVDANPTLVLDDPVRSLVHAIISSPYLSWMQQSGHVLKRTFHCLVERKGEKEAVKVCVDALKGTLDSRASFQGIWCSCRNEAASDAIFDVDEESLAFELVVASYSLLKLPPLERDEKLKTLAKATREDLITFRMLCIALTFSPAKIACLEENFRQNSRDYTPLPSWEKLCEVSKSRALVDIATSTIEESFPRFLSIDDDHGSLCSLLCKEDDVGDDFIALFAKLQSM